MSTARTNEPATSRYHHGDLPAALRAATVELVAERGPVGFSLREVARRAGVSHAAPAHHFGDSRGLLTAVAVDGFTMLCDAFDRSTVGVLDPMDRLTALGKAYVEVATNHVGHFAVMWSENLIDTTDERFKEVSGRAYRHLVGTVSDVARVHNPELDVDAAATLTWSAVHGLAMLHCKTGTADSAPSNGDVDLQRRIEQFSSLLLQGFAQR